MTKPNLPIATAGAILLLGFLAGSLFAETPTLTVLHSGTFTPLYSFCSLSGCADGAHPYGNLIQATNGDLYGTTAGGGNNNDPNCANSGFNGCGTIFKITPSGGFTTLHAFCSQSECADGYFPIGALVQADNGDLYGTTSGGGNDFGTIFKLTPGGTFSTLYTFCPELGCPNGQEPYGGLALAGRRGQWLGHHFQNHAGRRVDDAL